MMLSPEIRHLFKIPAMQRSPVNVADARIPPVPRTPPVAPEIPPAAPKLQPRGPTPWPAARLALTNRLWGEGFIFPGGELETLRLAKPLGASAKASLLIVGVGNGGPASSVTRNLGAWVTALDSDPSLLAAARGLIKRADLDKKVTIDAWDPANPAFPARRYHHCLALEPLRGERPEPILTGLAQTLRPGGQLVMTELVADAPLDENDATVIRWAILEKRVPAAMVSGVAITRMLGRAGMEVRVAEDISDRHMDHSILGWRVLTRDLTKQKPGPQQAGLLVAEAELWLLRRRLIKEGRIRMMRWHAVTRATIA